MTASSKAVSLGSSPVIISLPSDTSSSSGDEMDTSSRTNGFEPIAIVGMGCRLPGAVSSPTELWEFIMAKRMAHTDKVPASRFNIAAYLHPNNERPGSFRVPGGCFLEGSTYEIDPVPFGISPVEALWLDPQQRRVLEVVYEAFENAGIPLDRISGSATGCFVGNFTADYQQMSFKEHDFRHVTAATGVDPGIVSNRISHVFNLKGPSVVMNTACSSSLYALHNACNAIRNDECSGAIVAGVNLLLSVDQHLNTAKLGVLSPTSICHTFDASADGYSRAEGIGALYIKRLADAVKDGDPIRAVIRSTATNVNGKMPDIGFTSPSVQGQADVITAAYRVAGLHPRDTTYVECHGTGTPVGDPIEARAISKAMTDETRIDAPILIGSVKPNFGHSEASSSITTIIKAVLAVEKDLLAPTAGISQLNPKIKWDEWKVKAVTQPTRFPAGKQFGYGGTNSHCIIENAESLVPGYQVRSRLRDPISETDTSTIRPYLLVFSAHDNQTLISNLNAFTKVQDTKIHDLAYTLSCRRNQQLHRTFSISRDSEPLSTSVKTAVASMTKSKEAKKIAMVFTGQGAQWATMGSNLSKYYPSFTKTIRSLDRVLESLPDPPSWNLEESLSKPSSTSQVNHAEFSQPLCTAIQIGVVNLLAKWEVKPIVTVGHSSGEIAAAYTAGLISEEEAIIAAFYRGKAMSSLNTQGAMLAVGLGADDVQGYLEGYDGKVMIACHNSPASVTLSGDAHAVHELQENFNLAKIFAKVLKTDGKAYHSPHMHGASKIYENFLQKATGTVRKESFRSPCCEMISSVTGLLIGDRAVDSSYWTANLINPVLFNQAVQKMLTRFPGVGYIIEIGPHAALSAPVRQICIENKSHDVQYLESLMRNKDEAEQLLKLAGSLWAKGAAIDLSAVTRTEYLKEDNMIIDVDGSLLTDLPTYQWTYSKTYWQEPRHSRDIRGQAYTRHDVLGRRLPMLKPTEPVWRNVLRHRDLPWLKHHSFGGDVMFPASGYLSMAMEAMTEIHSDSSDAPPLSSYTLRNISVQSAMVVPDDDMGIESLFSLRPVEGGTWYTFTVASHANESWKEHMTGQIGINIRKDRTSSSIPTLQNRASGKSWYKKLREVGFDYGATFQDTVTVYSNSKTRACASDLKLKQESGLMNGESRYVLHPGCLDSALQLIIPSIYAGKLNDVTCGMVFTNVEEMTIWNPTQNQLASGMAKTYASSELRDTRHFTSSVQVTASDGDLLADFTNVRCVSYEAAVPQQVSLVHAPEPYMCMEWKPDIEFLDLPREVNCFSRSRLEILIGLLAHKQPGLTILCKDYKIALEILSKFPRLSLTYAIGSENEAQRVASLFQLFVNVDAVVLDFDAEAAVHQQMHAVFDLVVASMGAATASQDIQSSRKFLSPDGKLLFRCFGISDATILAELKSSGIAGTEHISYDSQAGSYTVLSKTVCLPTASITSETSEHLDTIVLVYRQTMTPLLALLQRVCTEQGWKVRLSTLASIRNEPGETIIMLADLESPLLATLESSELYSLQILTSSFCKLLWATRGGLLSSYNPEYAMTMGFGRSLISENLSLDLVIVDFDEWSRKDAVVASTLLSILDRPRSNKSIKETEYVVNHGIINVGRVVPNVTINETFVPVGNKVDIRPLISASEAKAILRNGEVVFQEKDRAALSALEKEEILIEVKAVALSRQDMSILTRQSQLIEFAGFVSEIGPSVSSVKIGDRVVGMGFDGISQYQRTSERLVTRMEGDHPFSLMASYPIAYSTAVYGLTELARIEAGDRVLIADETGLTLQAAIHVCKYVGVAPFIASSSMRTSGSLTALGFSTDRVLDVAASDVSSQLSRLTDGKGIDVVFISNSTENIPWYEISKHLALFARLVSFGAAESNCLDKDYLSGNPHNLSRFSFDLAVLCIARPHAISRVLKKATQMIEQQKISLTSAVTVGSISEIDDLLRTDSVESNFGKIVVTFDSNATIKLLPSLPSLRFNPDVTYLLVGCLGGLGRSLTSWMIEHGARHLAFMGRSGADSPSAASLIASIKAQNVNVTILQADVTVKANLEAAVKQIDNRYPIRGVVNAAMVLEDSVFQNMTIDKWRRVIAPKVHGSLNLHEMFQDVHELDFFVMTSSISGILGTPGQSNYAAANTFLDSLARHRRMKCLPAMSLILPMVLEVGYVAEHSELEDSLRRKGIYGIYEIELLRAFEIAMTPQPDPRLAVDHLIVGLEPSQLAKSASHADPADVFWLEDPHFHCVKIALRQLTNGVSITLAADSGQDIVTSIKSAKTMDDAITATTSCLIQRLSRLLMVDVADFQTDSGSIGNYGIDSMIGAEFRNWIFREFKVDVPFQRLLAADLTIRKFAADLSRRVRA
ncbi:hypothetical protein MMC25_003160 [Agyrium rufum]|nr:hypothetical protein [Agyrium rufum]